MIHLRYGNEFVRHKILDLVGDLYLAGTPLIGHFRGSRSGHAMNHLLLETLFADKEAWSLIPMTADAPSALDMDASLVPAQAPLAATAGGL